MPDGELLPDLREVLGRYAWHDQAACAGREDLNWFPDMGATKDLWEAAAVLAPLLVCEMCPVRRLCLEEGLRTWPSMHWQDEVTRQDAGNVTHQVEAWGIWGGTVLKERHALRHLTVTEAADRLEAGLSARVERRIAAWRAHTTTDVKGRGRNPVLIELLKQREELRSAHVKRGR